MIKQKNRIGIVGIGAIGSVMSFLLKQSTHNELFHFNKSVKKTIKIISKGAKFEIPINTHTTAKYLPKLDWLIVCLKEHHYQDATTWFEKLIEPTTKVVIIRNGLRLKEPLLKFAPEKHILECMIDCPIDYLENGFYHQLYKPIISIQNNHLAVIFSSLFDNKIGFNLVLDFKTQNWKKLAESSALGAILCLTGESCWIFEDKKMQKLYVDILEEIVRVAKADGARIKDDFSDKMVIKLMNYPKTKGSSMLSDRQRGSQIELGAKNGIVSELGKLYGIKTPFNDLITTLLKHTNRSS